MLNKEIVLAGQQKEMAEKTQGTNVVEKDAKDARWPNMYGDLDAQPDVSKDMVAGAVPREIKWDCQHE